jgi:hypothetical protein
MVYSTPRFSVETTLKSGFRMGRYALRVSYGFKRRATTIDPTSTSFIAIGLD